VDGGGLARAVRAEKPEELGVVDFQVQSTSAVTGP